MMSNRIYSMPLKYISSLLTHTQGYYSAMLKKETLPFATTWEDFECTMLTQTQVGQRKANTMISLVWGIYKS